MKREKRESGEKKKDSRRAHALYGHTHHGIQLLYRQHLLPLPELD